MAFTSWSVRWLFMLPILPTFACQRQQHFTPGRLPAVHHAPGAVGLAPHAHFPALVEDESLAAVGAPDDAHERMAAVPDPHTRGPDGKRVAMRALESRAAQQVAHGQRSAGRAPGPGGAQREARVHDPAAALKRFHGKDFTAALPGRARRKW